jgi:Fe-S-cluster containining protein
MPSIYVCDQCALCCQHLLVEADALDVLREPKIEEYRPLGSRAIALPILHATWVLAGPGYPCPFLASDLKCSIYASRPQVCVRFAAGSFQCQELRKAHGVPRLRRQVVSNAALAEIQAAIATDSTDGL